jgi:hypothetical protein
MPALILRAFLLRRIALDFWLLTPLLFASGYLLGRWHNRRWRRDRALRKAKQMTLTPLT